MGVQTLRRWPLLYMLDIKGYRDIRARSPKRNTISVQRWVAFPDPCLGLQDSVHLW